MITKEDMHNFYFQYIVREDLNSDPWLSLNLLEAAENKDWQRVETLLEQGADPRICRSTDNDCVESALVMALAARRYDIAKKLYGVESYIKTSNLDRKDLLTTQAEILKENLVANTDDI